MRGGSHEVSVDVYHASQIFWIEFTADVAVYILRIDAQAMEVTLLASTRY